MLRAVPGPSRTKAKGQCVLIHSYSSGGWEQASAIPAPAQTRGCLETIRAVTKTSRIPGGNPTRRLSSCGYPLIPGPGHVDRRCRSPLRQAIVPNGENPESSYYIVKLQFSGHPLPELIDISTRNLTATKGRNELYQMLWFDAMW